MSCDGIIQFTQGDIVDIVLYLSDECNANKPVNLTGATVVEVAFPSSPSNLIVSLGSGVTILDAAAGAISVTLSSVQSNTVTASTPNAKGVYSADQDIEIHYEIGSSIEKYQTVDKVLLVKPKELFP